VGGWICRREGTCCMGVGGMFCSVVTRRFLKPYAKCEKILVRQDGISI
jgi:hypothetical protein